MRDDNYNCDLVAAMEEMGVGVEEILAYARAVLPPRHIATLIESLQAILHPKRESSEDASECEVVPQGADAVSGPIL